MSKFCVCPICMDQIVDGEIGEDSVECERCKKFVHCACEGVEASDFEADDECFVCSLCSSISLLAKSKRREDCVDEKGKTLAGIFRELSNPVPKKRLKMSNAFSSAVLPAPVAPQPPQPPQPVSVFVFPAIADLSPDDCIVFNENCWNLRRIGEIDELELLFLQQISFLGDYIDEDLFLSLFSSDSGVKLSISQNRKFNARKFLKKLGTMSVEMKQKICLIFNNFTSRFFSKRRICSLSEEANNNIFQLGTSIREFMRVGTFSTQRRVFGYFPVEVFASQIFKKGIKIGPKLTKKDLLGCITFEPSFGKVFDRTTGFPSLGVDFSVVEYQKKSPVQGTGSLLSKCEEDIRIKVELEKISFTYFVDSQTLWFSIDKQGYRFDSEESTWVVCC